MVSQQSLLSLLVDGEWHSGEALGEAFGISRAAIWKQLQQLQAAGLVVDSERGKGYRLSHPLQLLDGDQIRSGLSAAASRLLSDLDIEFSIDSTNSRAMKLVAAGQVDGQDCSGRALFAEQQTAGRGRRGRTWVSPLGRNIYSSLIWRFASGAAALSGLSLAVGVAAVKALEQIGYTDIELKWPNDLLWRGRKLGGILLEMSGDAAGPCDVVIGIGINLTMSEMLVDSLDESAAASANSSPVGAAGNAINIDQPWVDLLELGGNAPVKKNTIAAELLNQLLPMLVDFEKHGFASLVSEWQARDAFVGCDVQLQLGAEKIIGKYVGIEADGSITIATATGKQSFNGGEVSLRGLDNKPSGDS